MACSACPCMQIVAEKNVHFCRRYYQNKVVFIGRVVLATKSTLRGYYTPDEKLACFVLYLKIINTFFKIIYASTLVSHSNSIFEMYKAFSFLLIIFRIDGSVVIGNSLLQRILRVSVGLQCYYGNTLLRSKLKPWFL